MKKFILLVLSILYLFVNIIINQVCACAEEAIAREKFITKSFIMDGINETEGIDDKEIITLEELVNLSDIIVVGKIVSVEFGSQIGKWGDNPNFCRGHIDISRVLKGDDNLKSIVIVMPPLVIIGKGLEKWSGPIYQKGLDEGVWFLSKKPKEVPISVIKVVQDKDNYYFANEVGSYKPLSDDLLKKIAAIQTSEQKK